MFLFLVGLQPRPFLAVSNFVFFLCVVVVSRSLYDYFSQCFLPLSFSLFYPTCSSLTRLLSLLVAPIPCYHDLTHRSSLTSGFHPLLFLPICPALRSFEVANVDYTIVYPFFLF